MVVVETGLKISWMFIGNLQVFHNSFYSVHLHESHPAPYPTSSDHQEECLTEEVGMLDAIRRLGVRAQ
jgi:hypothetical protein